MWVTVDCKGNIVKWYEAELIEKIKAECQEAYDSNDKFYNLAQRIMDLIQENEK